MMINKNNSLVTASLTFNDHEQLAITTKILENGGWLNTKENSITDSWENTETGVIQDLTLEIPYGAYQDMYQAIKKIQSLEFTGWLKCAYLEVSNTHEATYTPNFRFLAMVKNKHTSFIQEIRGANATLEFIKNSTAEPYQKDSLYMADEQFDKKHKSCCVIDAAQEEALELASSLLLEKLKSNLN